jgi:RimJ/RimL family protein N-acetyltransferase
MNIVIRPFQEKDINQFYSVVIESASHLRPWMPWCHESYCVEDTQQWILSCINDWESKLAFRYIIENIATHEILGSVGIERIVWAHKTGELGYWVSGISLNNGVATKAARLAVNNAFQEHGLQRVEINVLTNNHASNKVAKKIGALLEGTFRNKIYYDGKSYPANCYSIVPTDYENE